METPIILACIVSIFLSGLLTWLITRSIYSSRLATINDQLKQREDQYAQLQNTLHQIQREKETLLSKSAIAETQLQHTQSLLNEAKLSSDKMSEQLKLEMEALAERVMRNNSAQMVQRNEEKMGEILAPLKTELGDFKKKVEETYEKESKERFSLGKEIDRLVKMTEQVSQEANNLSSALKSNTKMQGNWGEMILESILEHSGLTKGREYVTQEFIRDKAGNIIKDDQGHGLQPDVTISYPDERKVIVDSKVSLVAWEQYVSESEITKQEQAMKQHILSLRNHIDGLSKKIIQSMQ